jgi:hypothetical protein
VTGQLHINVNILNAGVFGGSWRFPGTDGLASYTIEHYTAIAKKAEEAKLDAVFLADGPVLDPQVKYRTGNNLEPTTVLARVAAQTERIGLIATLSSSYNDPVEVARRLTTRAEAATVFVSYSLSPEAKYPTAIEEIYAALEWIVTNGADHDLDPGRIAVAGDSVGGNMTAAVTILAKRRGGPRIAGQLLYYPVTDAAFDTGSYHQFATGSPASSRETRSGIPIPGRTGATRRSSA